MWFGYVIIGLLPKTKFHLNIKMKIGYDAKRIFNNTTGLGNYSRALLRNVHQFYPENEYLLFTPKINDHIKTTFFQQEFKIIQPNILPQSIWRTYYMSEDIQKEKVDIFHGLSNEIPRGLKPTKSIVTIHDVIFKILPQTYPFIDRNIYNKKIKYSCENADIIIAISESTKQDILKYYPIKENKIKVVYQSCHPIYYEKNNWNNKALKNKLNLPNEFMLSVGSLELRKNTLIILKAIKAIPEKQRIPLFILGKGEKYKNKLQKYIQENKLKKWIFFIEEFISLPELKCLYELATLIVYPSLYEGFGLPVVEGLLSKTPVITSNVSSLPEAAGLLSLTIDPRNEAAIKDAILKVLADSELQNKMIEEGYKYALSKFSPREVTKNLMDIYRDIS